MNQRILPKSNKHFKCSFTQMTYDEVKDLLDFYDCEILIGNRIIIGDFLIVPNNYNYTKKIKHAKEQAKPIVTISELHGFIESRYY